ncbi:MAG: type I 3-dehydroquinate dehydratase [Planctomycetes bacterium]|nr:type I 3-dehydroquinate dehydratase [Planctomycetota bacterium]
MGNQPPICATVLEPTVEAALARMAAVAPWCARVEVRLDALAAPPDDEALAALVRGAPRPVLATCRPTREGGRWRGGEAPRLALLARAAALGADWVDVEWDAAGALPRVGAKVLVSRHAPPGTRDVEPLLRSLRQARADAQKLAVPVDDAADALRLLARCAGEARPTACVAIGPAGVVSRVAGTRWGAPWLYASADPARPAAPGSLGAEALAQVLAGRAPGRATALFGVAGRPVGHSRSPRVHGAAFAALGVDAVLSWLETADPAALLAALEADAGARGLAVTLPHKAAFARLLLAGGHALAPEARATGAVNTVVRRDGRWSGHNTDALAALDLLGAALGDRAAGARVGVVGAGGAARAVAWAAARLGARVLVYGRTVERARDLARDLPRGEGVIEAGGALADLPGAGALDVVVNATPVGMTGDPRAAAPPDLLGPGVVAYDLVYTPPETPFLRLARARGAATITGVDHFAHQARAQVALWLEALGRDPAALEALPLAWFEARVTAATA